MLIQPSYFPNIETFQHLMKAETIIFEIQDYYQKQTYRTRCNIYSANGLLSMNIPIKHQKMERQYTKEVKIENGTCNGKKIILKRFKTLIDHPHFLSIMKMIFKNSIKVRKFI